MAVRGPSWAAQGSAVERAQRRRTEERGACCACERQSGSAAGAPAAAERISGVNEAGAGGAAFEGAGAVGRSGQQSPAPSQVQPLAPESIPAGQHAISCALAAAAAPASGEPRRQDQQQNEARALATGERHRGWV